MDIQGNNLISFILRELNNVEMDDNQNEEEIKVSSDEFIESLKIEENQNEDITCSICLEDIKKGDKCITLPCKDHPHIFCANNETCPGIISWLKNQTHVLFVEQNFHIKQMDLNRLMKNKMNQNKMNQNLKKKGMDML